MAREHRSIGQVVWDIWHELTGKRTEIVQTAPLPWDENWTLDKKFFKDLANWDHQHQDLTFVRVVERIGDAMITCKPFLQLIPDAPFPARSLVQALSYLLQLGVTVARAKGDVFRFVDEISSWVAAIEANFGDGKGKFSSRARNNLRHMRDLLNEIFKWGWSRLNDGRWEMLVHGITIVDEIQDFKQRLSIVREMVSALQDINMVLGVDEILQQIRDIKRLQESQLGEILDHLKRRQLADERRQFLERTLYRRALQDTGYDDQGKIPCDPDTRVTILATIEEWLNDLSEGSQNFFWLTGDPGSGKSAITASFARHCKDSGVLWAQFFINRNNESTTNPRYYFPSIALQMAEHISDPAVTVVIHEILRQKESLLDEMTLDQGLEFFVKVVQTACDLDRNKPVAIIFDGLDETSRQRLEDTATIFSGLFTKIERRNAKVFISSRTDDEITRPFYTSLQTDLKHVKHLYLDTSGSRTDVEMYLRRHVNCLVEKWALDWKQWPGEERFQELCVQAGGLFIWAATVVKFFRIQLEKHGRERRKKILDIFTEKGMGDVNTLYGMILGMTIESDDDNDWEYERFQWIVGFIIALKEPLTVGDLSGLLDLRESPDSDPVDIPHFVTNLRTVLVTGTEKISRDTIPRLHKSFVEYVTSKRADLKFRIDVPIADNRIATKCLRLVGRLKYVEDRDSLPPGIVRYAIRNWTRHFPRNEISESGLGIVGSSAEEIWEILSTTATLTKGFRSASGDYLTHMYDPTMGLPPPVVYRHSSTIRGSSSIWAVAASPDGKLIASGDSSGAVQIWDSRSCQPVGRAGKHVTRVRSVSFSPDSRWVVSGGLDKTVRIWDCETGTEIDDPLLGHTNCVRSVCTDGQVIISGSEYGTIRIWSCRTHQVIGKPINAGNGVFAVALSQNGRIAAGVDHDVYIYDMETQRQITSMKGHTDVVYTTAFSPDGSRIASGSADNTVRIWDVQSGDQIYALYGHTGEVQSVAFSPDGKCIASGSRDHTIRLWNAENGHPIGHPLTGHTKRIMGVTFSADGCQVISGSHDGTIRIWTALRNWSRSPKQITTIHCLQHPTPSADNRVSLESHPSVVSACCSPDGTLYAASTSDGHVSIWNTERTLLWETSIPIHPIHLLRLSETRLVLSTPDGSTSSWTLLDGKPTHGEAITRGPQLNASTNRLQISADHTVWFPFDFDAGVWAYVNTSFICFGREEGSITIFDLHDLNRLKA